MFLYHLPKKIFPAQFPTSSITISLSSLSHVIVQFFLSRHGCTFSGLFTEFLCWAHDLISLNTISIAQKLSYLTFHSLLIHLNFPSKHENLQSFSSKSHSSFSLTIPSLFSQAHPILISVSLSIPPFLPVLLPFIFHWFMLHNCPLQAVRTHVQPEFKPSILFSFFIISVSLITINLVHLLLSHEFHESFESLLSSYLWELYSNVFITRSFLPVPTSLWVSKDSVLDPKIQFKLFHQPF